MKNRRKRRGVSFGTCFMILVTVLVCVGLGTVLPRLQGNTTLSLDAAAAFGVLNLSDVPKLSLSDIPIKDETQQQGNTATATPAPTLAPVLMPTPTPVPAGGSCTLTLGGSVMIETAVRKSGYYDDAETWDFTEIMSLLAPKMQADMTLVSLENLIYADAKRSDLVTVEEVVPMLTAAGVDAVALGFPKAYDQGIAGLSSTVNALHGKGLAVVGATAQEDDEPYVMMTLGGVKVAMLHYTDTLSSTGKKKIKSEKTEFALPVAEAGKIADDVAQARKAGAHAVIVSVNWGNDNKTVPSKAQKELAQQMADCGVDVILGTGTMAVQPVVWLEGKDGHRTLCAYSMGCLISDGRSNAQVAGVLMHLKLTVDADGALAIDKATYTPTYVWRYKQDGQYYYRIVPSNTTAPDGMSEDQQKSMTRALTTIDSALGEENPLTR
ncbi:MAG: CapA family protein [Clostridia bacterium]|nr:CapA family protein [Clostridia bacterium]